MDFHEADIQPAKPFDEGEVLGLLAPALPEKVGRALNREVVVARLARELQRGEHVLSDLGARLLAPIRERDAVGGRRRRSPFARRPPQACGALALELMVMN